MDTQSARVRHAALLHRSPDYDARLDELPASDEACTVRLGLVAAAHGGRWGRLIQALDHPSLGVRWRAVALLPSDPRAARAAAARLDSVAPAMRRRILDLLREAGVAEEWVDRVDPRAAARLLPGCGAEAVARLLPTLHPHVNWKWMALSHPSVTLAWIRRSLDEVAPPWRPWTRFAGAWPELSRTHPAEVLALVRDLADAESFPLDMAPLARALPDEVFGLMSPRRVVWDLARWLRPEQQEELAAWAVPEQPMGLATVLEHVPRPERGRVFEAALRGREVEWPTALLDLLPGGVRDREAARMLERRGQDRLRILARRAWAGAREELLAETRRAQGEERAQGWRLLIACAGLDSAAAVAEVCGTLDRVRNEQDPVRQAVAEGLAAVPVGRLRAAPGLEAFAKAVYEARDSSYATTAALSRLAMRMLRADVQVDTALRLVELGLGRSGMVDLGGLPRRVEDRVLEPVLRWMARLTELEQHSLALSVAEALGRRGWRHAGLQDALGVVALRGDGWTARRAIGAWLADPSPRDERLERLLRADASAIAVVWDDVQRRRQDLMPRFMDAPRLKGRFLTGETRWLPPVGEGDAWSWRPEDQRTLARHLDGVAADGSRTSAERVLAVRSRGRLTVTRAADLVVAEDVAVGEAALGALADLDRPEESLPVLLEWLDGDRARVAAYALGRVLRGVAPARGLSAVEELLARPRLKVTVEKEAVRLLGTLRAPGAGRLLRARWDAPDLHRDVRIAVLHAARELREWEILALGAASSDTEVARSMLAFAPASAPRTEAIRYLELVLQVGRHPAREVRKAALVALRGWAGLAPEPVGQAAAAAVLDLGCEDWREALPALVSSEASVCAQLAGMPVVSEADRDLPARQRLAAVVGSLVGRRPVLAPSLLRRIAGSVPPVEAARLRAAAIDWTGDPSVAGGQLGRVLEGGHRGVWQAARGVVLAAVGRVPDASALLPAVRELASGEPPARWMALELLGVLGPRAGWPAEWRDVLGMLREDAHPGIAEEAGRVWTVAE